MSESILKGDIVSVGGIFRDGTMDERRTSDTHNIQWWRAGTNGGTRLIPVMQNGEPDVESYWFGRESGIVNEGGRVGVVSRPTLAGRN